MLWKETPKETELVQNSAAEWSGKQQASELKHQKKQRCPYWPLWGTWGLLQQPELPAS